MAILGVSYGKPFNVTNNYVKKQRYYTFERFSEGLVADIYNEHGFLSGIGIKYKNISFEIRSEIPTFGFSRLVKRKYFLIGFQF